MPSHADPQIDANVSRAVSHLLLCDFGCFAGISSCCYIRFVTAKCDIQLAFSAGQHFEFDYVVSAAARRCCGSADGDCLMLLL